MTQKIIKKSLIHKLAIILRDILDWIARGLIDSPMLSARELEKIHKNVIEKQKKNIKK